MPSWHSWEHVLTVVGLQGSCLVVWMVVIKASSCCLLLELVGCLCSKHQMWILAFRVAATCFSIAAGVRWISRGSATGSCVRCVRFARFLLLLLLLTIPCPLHCIKVTPAERISCVTASLQVVCILLLLLLLLLLMLLFKTIQLWAGI